MRVKPRDKLYCDVDRHKIVTASPLLNTKNLGRLLIFITDRYKVHIRKDVLHRPPPWTTNPVISEYRFTNVRREHDRQTRYLIENISRNSHLSLEDKIVDTFYFRAWNNWDTMRDLGGPWVAKRLYFSKMKDVARIKFKRLEQQDPDRKWWSSAYNQGGTKQAWRYPEEIGKDKEEDIPLRVFHIGPWLKQGHVVDRLLNASDQKEAFEVIKSVRGFSDFLAYQVFVDLTYIKDFPFSENEFVVAGPGCKKGLDYIFDDYDGMTYEEALFHLRDFIDGYFKCLNTNKDIIVPHWDPNRLFSDLPPHERHLNIMSLENCMCELSKYIRTIEGKGRPRVKYIYK